MASEDSTHTPNVPVTIKQVCTYQGQPDIKTWGGKQLQRCVCVHCKSGREFTARIGASGLQAGMSIILPDLRSWKNPHRPNEFLHAADSATSADGQALPSINAPPPPTGGGIPGVASPPATSLTLVQAQDAIDEFTKFCWTLALMRVDNDVQAAARIFPTVVMTAKAEAGLWEHYAAAAKGEKQSERQEKAGYTDGQMPQDDIPF